VSHPYLSFPPSSGAPPVQADVLPQHPYVQPNENVLAPQPTGGTFIQPRTWFNKVEDLPIVGRAGADAFREDVGQVASALADKARGYRTPFPYGAALSAAATFAPLPIPDAGPEARKLVAGLEDVLRGGEAVPKFAILSSDVEGLSSAAKLARHKAFGEMLQAEGWNPVEHGGGVWKNDAGQLVKENGYLIPDMAEPQARHYGARVGQQSVITNEGFHNIQTGETAPFQSAGRPGKNDPYTVLPGGKKKLAMKFDFDNLKRTGTPEPGPQGDGVISAGGTTLPPGAPAVLGASEPKYAYQNPATGRPVVDRGGTPVGMVMGGKEADVLGVAGRHLLEGSPGKAAWVAAMQKAHPEYAPYLTGWAGDRAYKVATRAKLGAVAPPDAVHQLAQSATGVPTKPWYHTWWPQVSQAFGKEDGEMLTRFHAALSAQASPERNAELSLAALSDYKAGKFDFPSVGTTGRRLGALKRLAAAGPGDAQAIASEGPKVNNFYLALKGHPDAVVLDRHMARAYLGPEYGGEEPGSKKLSDEKYYALDARVRSDAREAGVSPRDFQAMVWGGQTRYPFTPPEDHLWQHLASNTIEPHVRNGLMGHYPDLQRAVVAHRDVNQALQGASAPSHAAVKVGERVFEVPMQRGHAGALEQAIEALREPGFQPDDIMATAEDGYTRGNGKFIPRHEVENLHSSDFVRAKRANPRSEYRDDDR